METESYNDEIKYMDFDEFMTLGLLQEVNRKFFHPLGLAIEIVVNEETGKAEGFGRVWDYRDDPEGMFYAGNIVINEEKINNVEKLRASKLLTRSLHSEFKCDLDGVQVK